MTNAIPTRAACGIRGRDLRTMDACLREFFRRGSFKVVAAFLVVALAARIAVGRWSWHDLVAVAAVIAAQPFVEWLIHIYLLHAKPVRIGEATIDLPTSKFHRRHHKDPDDLDFTLLPVWIAVLFSVQIATGMTIVAYPLALLTGGEWLPMAVTCTLAGYVGLGIYEWCHYLIHTGYLPKSRYYASIWRGHRLHHYKNENYWLGITSNVGDHALRTFPDQATVPKSPTARTLGVEIT
jgi:hypothetical protein